MLLQYVGQRGPTRAYDDDAGLDLFVHGDWLIAPGELVDIDLGISIKSPSGYWSLLTGRSSAFRRGLLVGLGVIDPGYTGRLYAVARNITPDHIQVLDGERIAQLILLHNATHLAQLEAVQVLPETARGASGFGSSGR